MALDKEFNTCAEERVQRLLDRLSKVPEGAAVAEFLKTNDVKFSLQDNPANWAASTLTIVTIHSGVYTYKNPVIILKKDLSDDNMLQAIVHEAGHLKQHLASAGNPDRILTQDEYVLFFRVAEADAQSLATEVTWALKQAGDAGPWEATKMVGFEDVANAYEKAVTEDPSAAGDGRARRAAFDAWFDKKSRLEYYNDSTVNWMIPSINNMLNGYYVGHGMEKKPLDGGWLKKLDATALQPYLTLEGSRDIVKDAHYSQGMDLRPAIKLVGPSASDVAKTEESNTGPCKPDSPKPAG